LEVNAIGTEGEFLLRPTSSAAPSHLNSIGTKTERLIELWLSTGRTARGLLTTDPLARKD
jgi:hypothetical protein